MSYLLFKQTVVKINPINHEQVPFLLYWASNIKYFVIGIKYTIIFLLNCFALLMDEHAHMQECVNIDRDYIKRSLYKCI